MLLQCIHGLFIAPVNVRVQPHLSCFLLKFLNGSLVDSSAFVDQVAGGGGFTGVDMANNHDVDVGLFFTHSGDLLLRNTGIISWIACGITTWHDSIGAVKID